jgi:hypothetical protein
LKVPAQPSAQLRVTAPNRQLRTDSDAPEAGLLLTNSMAPVAGDCEVGTSRGDGAARPLSLVCGALGPVGEMAPASPHAETNVSETIADTSRVAILEFTGTSSENGLEVRLEGRRGTQRDIDAFPPRRDDNSSSAHSCLTAGHR